MTGQLLGLRSALVATIVAISVPVALGAQGTPVKPLQTKPMMSCGPLALIMVKVVDSKGAPVTDAKIGIKRQRDRKTVPVATTDTSPTGEYVVVDDSALPFVPAAGASFVIRVSRGKQVTSAIWRMGRTPDGCHVVRLSGDAKLVLRR